MIEETGIEPLLAMVKKSRDQGVNDPQLDGVISNLFYGICYRFRF